MPTQIVDSPKQHAKKSPSTHSSRSASPALLLPLPSPLYEPSSVPPDTWTYNMLHLWKEALEACKNPDTKPKKLVTIDDLAISTDKDLHLNSPRSIEACLHLGIDPSELLYRSPESFHEKGLTNDFQQLKFFHHENIRKEKLQKLQAERGKIIFEKEEQERLANERNMSPNKYKGPKDFNEKERQRKEVLRRRQQRELEQMAKFEAQRQQIAAEAQARLEAEKRAEEQKRMEKARKEKEWQAEMRRRELQRMKEEEAKEKKSRQLAAERYMRELQQLSGEQAKMRQQHKETMRKEQERLAKQEELCKQMEKLQEGQKEILRKKQDEMLQKDKERQRFLEEQNKERIRQHMEARKQAEARHLAAVGNFYELMRKREEGYQRRQEELNAKLKKQEEKHKITEIEKKKKEEMKEQHRLVAVKEAQAERDRRIQVLQHKAEEADMILQNFMMQRQLEHARKMVQHQLEFKDKHKKAESLKRVKALHRFQILQRIEAQTERLTNFLEARMSQKERHRKANANLSLHRQTMLNQMEKLSISKKWRDSLSEADRAKLEDAHKQRTADNKQHLSTISEEA